MSIYYFISRRFGAESKKSFSSTVSKIAILSIGIALAILMGAFLILGGFKNNIRDKIFSFDSHIQIFYLSGGDLAENMESSPISIDFELYQNPKLIPGIKNISVYNTKVGMILENGEVNAVMMKGIGEDYDPSYFQDYILKGRFPAFSLKDTINDVLLSQNICNKLELDTGQSFIVSFLRFSEDSTRFVHKQRKFVVCGVFKTDLPEIDEKLIICDHKQIRWVNRWNEDEVGGFEVVIEDPKQLEFINNKIHEKLGVLTLKSSSIQEKYYALFDWLEMLNMNVKVLIVIVFGIACLNIFSILLILVFERTHTIGVLKALGATDLQIFRIFWVKGIGLLLKGILLGNILGLGVCGLQYFFEIIPLDPENYYMSTVPIDWNWPIIIALNLFVLIFVNIVLIVPVLFITAVKPIRAIRFS